jgi:predicted RND superfamily exporter protein
MCLDRWDVLRRRDASALLLVLAVTAIGAMGFVRLPIDVENAAMKSVGTHQAEVAARAAAEFGVDRTVLLLLAPRSEAAQDPGFEADARTWLAAIRQRPGVTATRLLPGSGAGKRLVAVDLEVGPEGRYAGPVRALIDAANALAPPTHRVCASGFPVGEIAIAEGLVAEQARIVPLVAAALFLLLLACYRRLSLALAPLLATFAGILVLGGVQHALGLAIDPMSALLAPVLLAVGVAGCVHLIEGYVARRRRGEDADTASRATVRDLLLPATLAVATTVAGFAGLLSNPIPAVQRFGLLAILGVTLTCGISILTIPPWLRLFARRVPAPAVHTVVGSWRSLGSRLVAVLGRRARLAVTLTAVVTMGFAWAWSGLRVDTDPILVLPHAHPFRLATERISQQLGGVDTFDLLLEAPQPSLTPMRLALLESELRAMPGIAGPAAVPRQGGRGSYLLPLLLRPAGATAREATFAAAEAAAQRLGWANAHATGMTVLVARDSDTLVRGQVIGLLFTLACLWISMAVGFRSARLATLGMVPNVVPCVLLYGGLALSGRPLSVGSAMIGSVLLGLIVDNTIHYLHGYRRARLLGSGVPGSLRRAYRRSGRAIVVTSLVLALGFAAGISGELVTTREFGVLAAGTILLALAADLLLLPAVVLLGRRPSEARCT